MTDHTALIAKLKAATGPSEELDKEIALAVGTVRRLPANFTSSLNAVLATARSEVEQLGMLCAALSACVKAEALVPVFELCRAALLVRLGGE